MLRLLLSILFIIFFISNNYAAREGTGYNRGSNNKNIGIINDLLDNKNYKKSIELIKLEIQKDKSNADLYNYLGYAYRKSGNFALSIQNYKEALRLNPNHSEAHNYIGIAYIKVGKIEKAIFHLKILEKLCEAKCEEYKSLEAKLNNILKNEN
jgi:tetratricopeptide (TPR) repeat protein